jgi:molybdopterin/thiamine biosynthesis adenylyltransferase
MTATAEYTSLTARNSGFLSGETQRKIRGARVLVAGCGLGSVIAELLARTGFTELTVADGDRVEVHNLNRQLFGFDDVGGNKAERLAGRLRAIHPEIHAQAAPVMLGADNIPALLSRIDIIVDSIDFLDAAAILTLHREARARNIPVISPVAAGWGSAALVFDPRGMSLHEMVGLPADAIPEGITYSGLFLEALSRLGQALPDYVAQVVREQFQQIRERRPCPISQLGAGTFSAAALTASLLVRILSGETVPLAPSLIVVDPLSGVNHGSCSAADAN